MVRSGGKRGARRTLRGQVTLPRLGKAQLPGCEANSSRVRRFLARTIGSAARGPPTATKGPRCDGASDFDGRVDRNPRHTGRSDSGLAPRLHTMANILLLDTDEIAYLAMQGVLLRGHHRFARVETVKEAWDFVRHNVRVDLVFVELRLKEGEGLDLIERLKADPLLQGVPIVVYTAHASRETVKRSLQLHVQNFLLKPYNDEHIFAVIAKAAANPWYDQHFEEESSFCKLMGYDLGALHRSAENLRAALSEARPVLLQAVEQQKTHPTDEHLIMLATQAEAVGAWGIAECLKQLSADAQAGEWEQFSRGLPALELADRLLFFSS